MPGEHGSGLAGGGVPQPCRPIGARGENLMAVRAEVGGGKAVRVAAQLAQAVAAGRFPDARSAVRFGGEDALTVRAELGGDDSRLRPPEDEAHPGVDQHRERAAQGEAGVVGRLHPRGLERQQHAELGVLIGGEGRGARQLAGEAPVLLLAADRDVVDLQGRRSRLLASAGFAQPGFGPLEVDAAQQQGTIVPARLPLAGPQQQAAVGPPPLRVGVHGFGQRRDGAVEIVGLAAEDPLPGGQDLGELVGRGLAMEQRQDALVVPESVLQLPEAEPRGQRVGADDEAEDVGALDGGADLRPELLAGVEVVEVDPDVAVELLERRRQPPGAIEVLARVREEDVGHDREALAPRLERPPPLTARCPAP